MRTARGRIRLFAAVATLAVSACGGGGAGGAQVAPTPAPPPTPPPPPPPPPPPAGAYLTPGVSQSTDFAVLGWEVEAGDSTLPAVATNGFTVRYDAASQSYSVALPSYQGAPASTFQQNGVSSLYYSGLINGSGINPATMAVRRPGPYQFTNIAGVDTLADSPTSIFAFGLATSAGSVPVTGSASYSADAEGTSLSNLYYFRGGATLNFDFGAGTLGGQMALDVYDLGGGARSIGTYSFLNTVYASGSTTFSGSLLNSSNGLGGAFLGQFTGPNAEELMARWNLEFLNPDSSARETAVGALIGRRGP